MKNEGGGCLQRFNEKKNSVNYDIFWKAAKNLGVVKIIVVLYFNDITFINGKYKTKFKKIHD
jgi:hypothetical protein